MKMITNNFKLLFIASCILLSACTSSEEQLHNMLISKGYNLSPDSLADAIKNNDTQAVTALLELGVNVEETNKRGEKMLILASRENNTEIGKILLVNRANINQKNLSDGRTALIEASDRGNKNFVNFLINNNADTSIVDFAPYSALQKATSNGNYEIVRLLAPISKKHLDTSLMIASISGDTKMMDILLKNGAFPDQPTQNNYTPLMMASKVGNIDAVKLLVKNGASRVRVNSDNETATEIAEKNNQPEIAKFLREKADKFIHDSRKLLPLDSQVVSEVAEEEAKSNTNDENIQKDGATPSKSIFAKIANKNTKDEKTILKNTKKDIKSRLNSKSKKYTQKQNYTPQRSLSFAPSKIESTPALAPRAQRQNTNQNVQPINYYNSGQNLNLASLNNQKLPQPRKQEHFDIKNRIKMIEYKSNDSKFALIGVNGNKAKVKKLYGRSQTREIPLGATFPGTNYQLVDISSDLIDTKNGTRENTYTAQLVNTRTGTSQILNKNRQSSSSPQAVVQVVDTQKNFVTKIGDRFQVNSEYPDNFRVIDVRPNDFIVRNIDTGETIKVPKGI